MKDPFEAAFEDQESPPESPVAPQPPPPDQNVTAAVGDGDGDDEDEIDARQLPMATGRPPVGSGARGKDEEEEDEEENMGDVEFGKFSSAAAGDPDKMAKMQAILSQFTEEQMSRYESFRRSGFQKANMKRVFNYSRQNPTIGGQKRIFWPEAFQLLASIIGSQKISIPMTIVISGIAKMFVGELVETGRVIMAERNENGPIRPCHIREAYRRLKLEGKAPKRSVPRLFR